MQCQKLLGLMDGQKVLVIDTDRSLVRSLEHSCASAGAAVHTALGGRQGLRRCRTWQPDLVIGVARMPDLDGWEACSRIRGSSGEPVFMISSKGTEDDIIRGLQCGAVDYISKPFSVQVLLARARAALRRISSVPVAGTNGYYDDGYLSIDLGQRRVTRSRVLVDLTATEYRLLAELFRNAGRVLTYDQILEAVWGDVYRDSPQYVHVYVYRLRQKLEDDPSQPRYLMTEHGMGYRFEKQAFGH